MTGPASQVVTATADVSGINFANVPYNPAFPIYPRAELFTPDPNPNATTAYVLGLYHAILGRDAEPAGLAFWVNALNTGMPIAVVDYSFVNSMEHRLDEVTYYYATFLGRAPDPLYIDWVNELLNGGNEAAVIKGILTSPEYTASHAGSADFVSDLYFQLLGRQANSAEQTPWEQLLASGVSRAAVVASFLNSQESVELASESFYAAFLHRAKDQPGDDYWTNALATDALTFGQVASEFFSVSPQEFQGTAARSVI